MNPGPARVSGGGMEVYFDDESSHTFTPPSDPEIIRLCWGEWWKQVIAALWPVNVARHFPLEKKELEWING